MRCNSRCALALCLSACAVLLAACNKPVAHRSQGARIRNAHETPRAVVSLAQAEAPAWAQSRNDASQALRTADSSLARSAFASQPRPDAYRPRRIYYTTQENTFTFFRLEGTQFREQRSQLWVP